MILISVKVLCHRVDTHHLHIDYSDGMAGGHGKQEVVVCQGHGFLMERSEEDLRGHAMLLQVFQGRRFLESRVHYVAVGGRVWRDRG